MERLLKNTCGYSGYTCEGIPDLNPVFTVGKFVCSNDPSGQPSIDTAEGTVKSTSMDNYLNLPTALPPVSPYISYIADMSLDSNAVSLRVPAVSCEPQTGASSIKLDLLQYYGNKIVAGSSDTYTALSSQLPCFSLDSPNNAIKPGLTEPAPPVEFDPIVPDVYVDYNPGLYLVNDYVDFDVFEDFLDNFDPVGEEYDVALCGMEDLLAAMADGVVCDSIQIKLVSGNPLVKNTHIGSCIYELTNSAGTGTSSLYVNGRLVTFNLLIDGQSTKVAPFSIYLNIPDGSDTAYISTTKGENAISLGGVRLVKSEDHASISEPTEDCQNLPPDIVPDKYEMYVVDQTDCPEYEVTPQEPWEETVCNLEALMVAMVDESACESIRIQLISGMPLSEGGTPGPCEYGVVTNGGTIVVDGKTIHYSSEIDGSSSVAAGAYSSYPNGFTLYLNIEKEQTSSSGTLEYVARLSTTAGTNAIAIGGVRMVDGSNYTSISGSECPECENVSQDQPYARQHYPYKMLVIDQFECPEWVVTPQEPPDACSMERLITAITDTPECSSLQIIHESGTPIVSWSDDPSDPYRGSTDGPPMPENRYWVKGISTIINNKEVVIPDLHITLSGSQECTVYLVINRTNTGGYVGHYSTQSEAASMLSEIGQIKIVNSKKSGSIPDDSEDCDDPAAGTYTTYYKIYNINQTNCMDDIVDPPDVGIIDDIIDAIIEPECDNFKFEHTHGGRFNITGSRKVRINGVSMHASGLSSVSGSSHVWLNFDIKKDGSASCKLSTSEGKVAIEIAHIVSDNNPVYRETGGYRVIQYMCEVDQDLIRLEGEEGFIMYTGPGKAHPYKRFDYCDET